MPVEVVRFSTGLTRHDVSTITSEAWPHLTPSGIPHGSGSIAVIERFRMPTAYHALWQASAMIPAVFGWEPVAFHSMQVSRREIGQGLAWHRDENIDPYFGQVRRTFAGIIVALSPRKDYDGGEIEFRDGTSFRLPAGAGLLVRGDVEHRVADVVRGVRWSMTAFVADDYPSRPKPMFR